MFSCTVHETNLEIKSDGYELLYLQHSQNPSNLLPHCDKMGTLRPLHALQERTHDGKILGAFLGTFFPQ